MPSQNMLPKGKRRQSVKNEYRAQRTVTQEREAALREAGGEVEGHVMEMVDTAEFTPYVSPFAHIPGLVTSGPNGGKHPQEENTQAERRYPAPKVFVEAAPEIQVMEDLEPEDGVRTFTAAAEAAGVRLDAYLAKALPDVSRARVQLLTENGQVQVDGKVGKSKQRLKGGELIEIEGEPRPEPLHAVAEDLPLAIVYEDDDMAVVNKAAGMMVHGGSGGVEHNSGTLVNALLHHFGKGLSGVGGELRPGIVHRLDKQTSGLIVVAKNDVTHRKLSEMFADRRLKKTYLALVHGEVQPEEGTIQLPISRDVVRRIRMTTKRAGGRSAVSHWKVLERVEGAYGKFTLVEVRIETGRTHQIRVHMQAIGHPVVGDFLYGAPHRIQLVVAAGGRTGLQATRAAKVEGEGLELERNFLHAAELEFRHPRTGEMLELRAELPEGLVGFLEELR
jgi:23S rRNA pseudouridine1911/1915/1917 synthase